MDCPNCQLPTDQGAAFCGNCGHALKNHVAGNHVAHVLRHQIESGQPNAVSSVLHAAGVPDYAIAAPMQHAGEIKAVLSLTLGLVGIVGALFVALVGLALGVTGLVLGTMSRNSTRRKLSTAGIITSSLAIVASLAVWAYVVQRTDAQSQTRKVDTAAVATSNVSTPCYSTGFIDTLNVKNVQNSCDMHAFNGPSLDASTRAYKVYANQIASVNERAFNTFAKQALANDIKTNLPGFAIIDEQFTNFAGSTAYVVQTKNDMGVAVTEAVVLHQTRAGANVFVLVQASTSGVADLSTLEAQWQWR